MTSDAYQAMRADETPYYRLWWLLNQTGRPADELANTLLVATWESDEDLVRKRRYQTAFIAAAAAIPPDKGEDWFYYNLRAANALREMGEFERANALLAQVNASTHWPTDTVVLEYVQKVVRGLQTLIAERNPHPEPTNLIPPQMAVERCQEADASLSASERTACAGPEITDAIAARAAGDDWDDALYPDGEAVSAVADAEAID